MKYLFRLDDACETMDLKKWLRIEALFDEYGVKPLVAAIPNNKDPKQKIDAPYPDYWNWLGQLESKGWEIALHGYDHVYISKSGGVNPINNQSEFAGVPLTEQKAKIKKGFSFFEEKGFRPRIFVAPSHTFDENTLAALESESPIRIISDTLAFAPYNKDGFTFIPQQIGRARKLLGKGFFTFCYHPSVMTDKEFRALEVFLSKNRNDIISFQDLQLDQLKPKSIRDNLLSKTYFGFRKIFR